MVLTTTGYHVGKKNLLLSSVIALALAVGAWSIAPQPAVVIPAQLPVPERAAHRVLNFEGITNFRDLGGYRTVDGREVKWGVLYRSATLANATDADLRALDDLGLAALVDFRSAAEKQKEPDHLPSPPGFAVVEIPTLDGGDSAVTEEIRAAFEQGDFAGFDPGAFMLEANRQFADRFTPQFSQFMRTILAANGEPVLWHCTAGKDRTGFAAAILLRILGVPPETVLQDYAMSKEYSLAARRNQLLLLRLFKGEEASEKLAVLMGVEQPWLQAAFYEIDRRWGNFDNYVRNGLGLTDADIAALRGNLLL
jgi:protein-tyrosine phosphatase